MKLAQKAVLAATFAALSWDAIKAYPVEAATVTYDFTLTVTNTTGLPLTQSLIGSESKGFLSYDDSSIVPFCSRSAGPNCPYNLPPPPLTVGITGATDFGLSLNALQIIRGRPEDKVAPITFEYTTSSLTSSPPGTTGLMFSGITDPIAKRFNVTAPSTFIFNLINLLILIDVTGRIPTNSFFLFTGNDRSGGEVVIPSFSGGVTYSLRSPATSVPEPDTSTGSMVWVGILGLGWLLKKVSTYRNACAHK